MAEELDVEDGEEKPKRSKKLLILILIVIILGAGGAGAAFFLLGDSEEAADAQSIEGQEESGAAPDPVEKKEVVKVDPTALPEPAQYYNMVPEFVINLAPGSEKTYLVVKISLMTRDETILERLKTNDPLIRSLIIEILSSQKSQNLGSFQGKKDLMETILSEIQAFVKSETGVPGVERILFTHFIME